MRKGPRHREELCADALPEVKSVHRAVSFTPYRKFPSPEIAKTGTVSGVRAWPDFAIRSSPLASNSPRMAPRAVFVLPMPRFAARVRGTTTGAYQSRARQCSAGFVRNIRLE